MAHLFFIRRPIGTVDAIHPFEPPVRLRADLELHAAGCPSCTWGMRVLADSSLRAETITVLEWHDEDCAYNDARDALALLDRLNAHLGS